MVPLKNTSSLHFANSLIVCRFSASLTKRHECNSFQNSYFVQLLHFIGRFFWAIFLRTSYKDGRRCDAVSVKPFENSDAGYKAQTKIKSKAYLLYVEHLFLCSNAVDGMHIFKRVGQENLSLKPCSTGQRCTLNAFKKVSRIRIWGNVLRSIWCQQDLSSIDRYIPCIAFWNKKGTSGLPIYWKFIFWILHWRKRWTYRNRLSKSEKSW